MTIRAPDVRHEVGAPPDELRATAPVAVRCDGVGHSYRTARRGTVEALGDITLDVPRDGFVTIVGASGCGKSTLLNLIGGLLAPTSGRVSVDGAAVVGPRRDVAMVFQSAILLDWRTALDNVLFPVECLRLPKKEHIPRARELLALAGLEGFEHAYPRELSGGMQQRVSLCRALITEPRVILMDEPFAALDALTREEMSLELLRIWSERRKTVVFVTHSISEAILLADRVVVLTARPGRVAGTVDVDLPRPRTLDMATTERFGDLTRTIRGLIYAGRTDGA